MTEFKSFEQFVDKSRFKKRPRYSLVLHDVREKLGISLNTYVVVDSIHKLSSSVLRPGFETPGWAYSSGKL